MLVPSEFARAASIHGTVAVVSDPHEIANVLGIEGVRYFVENSKFNFEKNTEVNQNQSKLFKFYFGVPSCVPATNFETSGAKIDANDVKILFDEDNLHFLSEMMNFPGVIYEDEQVLEKIKIAKERKKVIDGHAPGLTKNDLKKYSKAGITTDHECTNLAEAIEKIELGMKIQIRNGSSAKDFENLFPLIDMFPDSVMFCSDDLHSADLLKSHINLLIKKSLEKGANLFNILKAASLNAINHYKLDVGQLEINDDADFVIVDNLQDFNILQTYCCGKLIAENGKTLINSIPIKIINNFAAKPITPEVLKINYKNPKALVTKALVNVIEVENGKIVTKKTQKELNIHNKEIISNPEKDILKLIVLNRYEKSAIPAIAFVTGFEISNGAIATSIAHDSHNIIAVGANDESICEAINQIISEKGGISVVNKTANLTNILPLPIAGLISEKAANFVAKKHHELEIEAKKLGTKLDSPFMMLSFLALLVIPELKLSDKGLFNSKDFCFEELVV
jgi:adenine deaminase